MVTSFSNSRQVSTKNINIFSEQWKYINKNGESCKELSVLLFRRPLFICGCGEPIKMYLGLFENQFKDFFPNYFSLFSFKER